MADRSDDWRSAVESKEGISVIHGSENCRGWNGIHYNAGMYAGSRRVAEYHPVRPRFGRLRPATERLP